MMTMLGQAMLTTPLPKVVMMKLMEAMLAMLGRAMLTTQLRMISLAMLTVVTMLRRTRSIAMRCNGINNV